jgi:glycosyltransferase EpsE
MNLKLVSVIMSVHNHEKSIKKSIESILNQDYKNLELLLIDDGSNDKTYEICREYSNSRPNVRLYQNVNNIGLTKSLNILINKAEGYFIARQDADDISSNSRLEKQLRFIEKYDLDACTTRAFVMNSKKITPSKSYYLPKEFVMRIKNPFIHGTLVAKKEVFYKVGLYNEKFYYSQDYKLMRDFLDNGYKLKILKEPLYFLNMMGNISVTHKEKQQYFADCVRKRILPAEKS